jgi:serine/threonine-protein kinase
LPFVNVGGDEDTSYLSDGIPASIIDRLSKLSALHVVPRSSAFHFRDPRQDLAEVGRRLDVNAILTGEVRSQDEALVIRVELVDLVADRQLWGERLTRGLDDVLETEVEIATHVAEALRIELSGEDRGLQTRGGTSNPVAHRHYLKGRYLAGELRSEDGFRRALDSYRDAIREDPDFALAYCGLAEGWLLLADQNHEPVARAVDQAKEALERALAIDPNLAEAHSFSALASELEWDPVTARREYLRALDLDPGSIDARLYYAWFLALQGKVEAALAEIRIVRETDPVSARTAGSEIMILIYARKYDEALTEVENALQLRPGDDSLLLRKGTILALQERYDDALAELRKLSELGNTGLGFLGSTFGRAGKRDDARSVLTELERRARAAPVSPVSFAMVHVGLGEGDLAIGRLEQALVERDAQLLYLKVEPAWGPIRDDPRFDELINRISYFAEE